MVETKLSARYVNQTIAMAFTITRHADWFCDTIKVMPPDRPRKCVTGLPRWFDIKMDRDTFWVPSRFGVWSW